jgi:hypothetical protein
MTALLGHRRTGTAGPPTWWASWMVRSAALTLGALARAYTASARPAWLRPVGEEP